MRIASGPIRALRDELRSRARMIWTNRTGSYGALRQMGCLRFRGACIVGLYLFSKNITISRKKW